MNSKHYNLAILLLTMFLLVTIGYALHCELNSQISMKFFRNKLVLIRDLLHERRLHYDKPLELFSKKNNRIISWRYKLLNDLESVSPPFLNLQNVDSSQIFGRNGLAILCVTTYGLGTNWYHGKEVSSDRNSNPVVVVCFYNPEVIGVNWKESYDLLCKDGKCYFFSCNNIIETATVENSFFTLRMDGTIDEIDGPLSSEELYNLLTFHK